MSPTPDEIHRRSLGRLARYVKAAEEILASWDDYSDQHTDEDGWPHDDIAYGWRQRRRDADTWHAFSRIRSTAASYLTRAQRQLRRLPTGAVEPRWAWQLKQLHTSLEAITTLQTQWLAERSALPDRAVPGTEEYDEPLADRNAEAWHHLNTWATHGTALIDIDTTARREPPRAQGLTTTPTTPVPPTPRPSRRRTP